MMILEDKASGCLCCAIWRSTVVQQCDTSSALKYHMYESPHLFVVGVLKL